VHAHVLSDFAKSDRVWLSKLLEGMADEVELLAEGKDEKFQSKVALVLNPPRPNAPREDKKD
jgi:peptidyl-tRNA hydrolase, PTH1 family